MRSRLILGCLLMAACTPPATDHLSPARDANLAVPASSRDGSYRGTGTPDAVQDARGCTSRSSYPKQMRIDGGHAVMNWGDGTAYGDVAADGTIELKSTVRLITLSPTATGYTGRVLAGYGPWCKSTLMLERVSHATPESGDPLLMGTKGQSTDG